MLASEEPLNDTEPDTSPVSEMVRDVSSVVAVEELPVTSPTRSAVTFAKVTEAEVPTA